MSSLAHRLTVTTGVAVCAVAVAAGGSSGHTGYHNLKYAKACGVFNNQ
jgi:hypothetical protein